MSTIHPELISLLKVSILKSNINTTDEFCDAPVKPEEVEINVGQNTAMNIEKKNVRIRLEIKLEGVKEEAVPLGLSGEFEFEFHFHIIDFEQFIFEKDNKQLIDRKLGGTLSGIVYSTARGILLERTASSFFDGVILPIIDPNKLLETA